MKEKKFLDDYFGKLKDLISFDKKTINKLLETKNLLLNQSKKGKKCMIFGNGGSAAIASHFSVDITKNAKVRCTNYNESDLLTCFSNDFGYDRWVQKTIEFYGNPGDVLIVISASGKSQNMVNACKEAKKKKFEKIITFTGFSKKNSVLKKGDINFHVESKAYNHIENVHQILLLSLIDLIIGKSNYSVK